MSPRPLPLASLPPVVCGDMSASVKISLTILNLFSGNAVLAILRSSPLLSVVVLDLFFSSQHHVLGRLDVDDDHGAECDEGGNAGNKENRGSSFFLCLHAREMRERSTAAAAAAAAAALLFCGKRFIP